jgi:hypothetical protein
MLLSCLGGQSQLALRMHAIDGLYPESVTDDLIIVVTVEPQPAAANPAADDHRC